MSGFLVVAAIMTVAALAFVLPPLLRRRDAALEEDRDAANAALYREQLAELERDRAAGAIAEAAYADARREIERRLLEDVRPPPAAAAPGAPMPKALPVAVGVLVPLVAIVAYVLVGTPAALDPVARTAPDAAHKVTPEQVAAMVEKLAERMKSNPDDAEGWRMLARSQFVLGNADAAAQAYAQLARLQPGDAGVLADYADALAVARGRRIAGEPYALVKEALAIDPKHVKALALAGSAEFEAGNYGEAAAYWERILPLVGAESEFGRQVAATIADARERGKGGAAPAGAPPASAPPAGATISGVVKVSPALANQVAPGDTLFVFARPADGARMPVAILRASAAGLPLRFTLDDSSAMSPTAKLSSQAKVVVEARISKSGNATAAKGDLRGTSAAVAPGAKDLEILIDAVVD